VSPAAREGADPAPQRAAADIALRAWPPRTRSFRFWYLRDAVPAAFVRPTFFMENLPSMVRRGSRPSLHEPVLDTE
jgi:hypothetical protein